MFIGEVLDLHVDRDAEPLLFHGGSYRFLQPKCPTVGRLPGRPEANRMCRWLGYFGNPIPVEELLYDAPHSLIEQSRDARLQASLSNLDGFGLGWYRDDRERPGIYRSITPAWSDPNLRELAEQIRSPLFLAHVRAATGTPVQQSQLPPVPPRPLAVRSQRLRRRVRARCGAS